MEKTAPPSDTAEKTPPVLTDVIPAPAEPPQNVHSGGQSDRTALAPAAQKQQSQPEQAHPAEVVPPQTAETAAVSDAEQPLNPTGPPAAVQQSSASKPDSVAAAADSDSDDDLPLAQRRLSGVGLAPAAPEAKRRAVQAQRQQLPKQRQAAPVAVKRKLENGSAGKPSAVKRAKPANGSAAKRRKPASSSEEESSSESSAGEEENDDEEVIRPKRKQQTVKRKAPETMRQRAKPEPENKDVKWTTLEHAGVLFPPDYVPHGIKPLYDGQPVDLTPEQEEVATFFAVMLETDYMKKPTFLKNFWEGFREVLGRKHTIQSLDKCDFRPIYNYHMAEREKIKNRSKEEKEAAKREKLEKEGKYTTAKVDGKVEQVGNFRVEPPGLFRGRGEHPKMGKIKRRIYPKDITINIGKGVPVPTHPYPGQEWREVRHDNTVTWLAYWHDPISPSSFKYVWLAANSGFKSESDLAKYEKARKLKDYIGPIRAKYEADWKSPDQKTRQIATALYFIDILALRAGHEKDEDEADTVGCCTLKACNVKVLDDPAKKNWIEFDFLGKDSVQYQKEVEVHPLVYGNISNWIRHTARGKRKQPEEQLFDAFDASDLNKTLKEAMEGLSAKVFRTYNASVTLDRLLAEQVESATVDSRKADYDRANKEVAVLCNHQRAVGKAHDSQMEKLQEKVAGLRQELAALRADLALAKAGKSKTDENGKQRKLDPHTVKGRIEKKEAQIRKVEISIQVKEDLKTVALGTSKINYMDPRISVAWCKQHEVPIEKIFNKSLMSKFHWAMDAPPDFRF